MSKSEQAELPQRPALQDHNAWPIYWKTQGQSWRTEPEIDAERQAYLTTCLSIQPDLDHGIYPFKGVKLERADVEWLLATHEDGRGPVDCYDEQQRERKGLDLRGADLQQIDLHHLPLTQMLGGLNWKERNRTPERRDMAAVHLESMSAILTEEIMFLSAAPMGCSCQVILPNVPRSAKCLCNFLQLMRENARDRVSLLLPAFPQTFGYGSHASRLSWRSGP